MISRSLEGIDSANAAFVTIARGRGHAQRAHRLRCDRSAQGRRAPVPSLGHHRERYVPHTSLVFGHVTIAPILCVGGRFPNHTALIMAQRKGQSTVLTRETRGTG